MSATQRRFEPGVIQRLLDEPYRFQFFQAVGIFERWLQQNGIANDSAVAEYLRFKNRTSLSFPASEIESLSSYPRVSEKTATGLLEGLLNKSVHSISITPTFMGLLGGNGALPGHYTERIAEHALFERDDGPSAFLDIFSNRALALFYLAWRKYRLQLQPGGAGQDKFLNILLSLSGLGAASLQRRMEGDDDSVLDEAMGRYASALSSRTASAAYIQSVLRDYFKVPIDIEQFIGCWYEVPPEQQTALGKTNAALGTQAMVGARVWQRDLRIRLVIGPLKKMDYESFLPKGPSARALEKMLTMFTGVCLEYEVQLILRKEEVRPARLTGSAGVSLGWDSYLNTRIPECDRQDICYEIHAL